MILQLLNIRPSAQNMTK